MLAVGRLENRTGQLVRTAPEARASPRVPDNVLRLDQQLLTLLPVGREYVQVASWIVAQRPGA